VAFETMRSENSGPQFLRGPGFFRKTIPVTIRYHREISPLKRIGIIWFLLNLGTLWVRSFLPIEGEKIRMYCEPLHPGLDQDMFA